MVVRYGVKTDKISCRETYSKVIIFNCNLFLAHSAPKFDSELGNIFFLILHAHNSQTEQSLLHIEAHLFIVGTHDTVQASKSTGLNAGIVGLCSLADNLHNVIPLTLVLHVGTHEVDRITQSCQCSISNFHVRLLTSSTLDDGC